MKRKKGFSFLEVMAAMFVVSFGLVAVIELFATGLINSSMDRDRIVAAGLAQEGLEIVKNIRDNNLVIPGNLGFENFGPLIDDDDDDNQCGLDYTDDRFVTTGGNNSTHNCFDGRANSERKFSLNFEGNTRKSPFHGTSTKWARVVYVFYDEGIDTDLTDDFADVVSIVWWSGSDTPPSSVPAGADQTFGTIMGNISTCTAQSKCVYATMHLDAWKP